MSTTESRSGFRLPWSSDRSHESQDADEPQEGQPGEPAAVDTAWPATDTAATRDPGNGWGAPPQPARDPWTHDPSPATPPEEPAMVDIASTTPAPATRKKPSKLMADLSAAIRATAEAARDQALVQVDADVVAVVDEIRASSKEGEATLKGRSDADIAEIREWSKAEIARIKEETDARIEARKSALAEEIAAHSAEIETRVGAVEVLRASYQREMAAYAERLGNEDDPARLATLAETMPEPPAFSEIVAADVDDLPQAPAEPEVEELPEAVAADPWATSAPAEGDTSEISEEPMATETAEAAVEAADAAMPADELVGAVAEQIENGASEDAQPVVTAEASVEVGAAAPVADAWGTPEPATAAHSGWADSPAWGGEDSFQRPSGVAVEASPSWGSDGEAGEAPGDSGDGAPVDRNALMAALEAAAEAVVAAESAAESADQAEAAADAAETAAELLVGRGGTAEDTDPEAQAAFSARVDAGGFESESFTKRLESLLPGREPAAPSEDARTTQVVVSGLVSVASIASFKRHLSRIPGVDGVAVASGPDGEFVFNVTHRADVSFRDAIPGLPGFAARVTSAGDGVVAVTARDPETEA